MRRPPLTHALLLALLVSVRSLGWPSGGTAKRALTATEHHAGQSAGLLDLLDGLEERTAARAKGPLALTLPSSSSCFHRALSSLPSSSSSSTSPRNPCAALAHSDAQRSALSAKMALCEIRTAAASGGKVPRECADWEDGKRRGTAGGCVEALSRSPQYWNSYSGHLREIVTICSVFRRWADLELARDLHSSTSRTFSAFVDELREFEQARGRRQAEDGTAARRTHTDLAALVASLSALSTSLTSTHATHASSLHSSTAELQAVSAALAQQRHILERELASVIEKVKREVERAGGEMALALRGSVEQHDASLTALSARLDDRLALSLDALSDRQAELTRGMMSVSADLVWTTQAVDTSLQTVNSLLLNLQPLSLSLASSLSGSLSSASQLEMRSTCSHTQLSTLSASHLSQASDLSAALANLTELVAAQQQGLSMGSTSWTGAVRLEDVVWTAQALWGPAQALLSSYDVSWMPPTLLALVVLAFPSAAKLPTLFALLALALRLSPLMRLFIRLFHHLPKQRLYRRRPRTVRFDLQPRQPMPSSTVKRPAVLGSKALSEREAKRFVRAASAPL